MLKILPKSWQKQWQKIWPKYSRLMIGVVILLALAGLVGGVALPVSKAIADRNSTSGHMYYFPKMNSAPTLQALGPDGGGVVSVLYNPKNANVAYVGTWGAGVYKSIDGGRTWRAMNNGLDNLMINSMVLDPQKPDTVYAGTYKSGVYKSTDGAQTWKQISNGLNQSAIVYALAVDPTNSAVIYAGTRSPGMTAPWGGGVFKTTDGGATWIIHSNLLAEDWVYGLAVDPRNTQIIYAALHEKGVAKSTDGAHSWKLINSGISDQAMRYVVMDPTNSQVLYAASWHGGSVFKTTNAGQSWAAANGGLGGAKIIDIKVDPAQPRTVYAMSFLRGLFRSDNGGSSWSAVGLSPYYVFEVAVNPGAHQTILASAVNDALYMSTNGGGTWTNSSKGLAAMSVTALASDPVLPGWIFAGTGMQGVFASSDSGSTVTAANNGLGNLEIRSMAMAGGILYAGTSTGGIYKSSNRGSGWAEINRGLPQADQKRLQSEPAMKRYQNWGPVEDFLLEGLDPAHLDPVQPKTTIAAPILALAVDPKDSNLVLAGTGGSGVYRTTNGSDWAASGLGGQMVYALAISPADSHIVFAGTDGAAGSVWKSSDSGRTWTKLGNGLNSKSVQTLAIQPGQGNKIYAGTSTGLYRSTDGGTTWSAFALAGQNVFSLLAISQTTQVLYAGTAQGVFVSADGGATWKQYRNGLANPEVWSLAAGSTAQQGVYLGTNTSGFYRLAPAKPVE
jgi:photosystem II stability/assembly factor-like uncharacterized protein